LKKENGGFDDFQNRRLVVTALYWHSYIAATTTVFLFPVGGFGGLNKPICIIQCI